MGQTPLFKVLTDTEYVCPPFGPLNHAHHGANSAALLPGRMQNRAPWVCRSGVVMENVWKAQEKRRGETRARAVSRGEMRHKLFLIKRQDRDLLCVMQRRHLKVSKSKATWPNHVDKRYKRYEKICSSGQKICEEQGWEQPGKYKVKVHR
jgi:hypothetical protein